jgi:uncharacterized protein
VSQGTPEQSRPSAPSEATAPGRRAAPSEAPAPGRPSAPSQAPGPGRPSAPSRAPAPTGPPAAASTPEPTTRLPPEARPYFVLGALAVSVPFAIAGFVVAGALAADALGWALRATAVAVVALGGIALPLLRWRSWRYELRDEELDLLRGAVVVRRTLIPMTRVQHVDTTRNVIGDLFELRSVVVHTAAGSNDIPALRPTEAEAIRDRIAQLARRPDEL